MSACYDDVPGVIGRVGTLSGRRLDIAGMTVSRSRRGGEGADGVTANTAPSAELVERLRGEGSTTRASSSSGLIAG